MAELDQLKASVKDLVLAIEAAGDDPSPADVQALVVRGCEVFANAVELVKAIWKR